ncbi:MAG: MarR family transcriptional regulator [Actinomycetota bacterium]
MTAPYDPSDLVGTGAHLSVEELRTWTRFLDAGRLVEELLSQHVAQAHGMSHSDYEVLVRLDGAGGEMRMTTLAGQVVSSAQKLTHTANRLEARGWIARVAVEEDGRGVMATLLPDGRAALAAAAGEHADLIKEFLLNQMTLEEQRIIADVMDRVATNLRANRRR